MNNLTPLDPGFFFVGAGDLQNNSRNRANIFFSPTEKVRSKVGAGPPLSALPLRQKKNPAWINPIWQPCKNENTSSWTWKGSPEPKKNARISEQNFTPSLFFLWWVEWEVILTQKKESTVVSRVIVKSLSIRVMVVVSVIIMLLLLLLLPEFLLAALAGQDSRPLPCLNRRER